MLQYLLKFSISLAVLYIFYRAVLRPLTFYQWNRFYLLCYSLLSFVIPFIDIISWMHSDKNKELVNIIPAITSYNYTISQTGSAEVKLSLLQRLTVTDWVLIVFFLGVLVMIIKLIVQYLSLRSIRNKAVLIDTSSDVQLYETASAVSPFSFGNAIYFNRQLHTDDELQRIIQHEFVHVKQKHTIDLLVGEMLCVINWFNPFAWFIRYSIRQNLEFIADNNVVANGLDKKEYQYLLLKVVGVPQYSIANNFNFSNLKKRIAMMNKMKSAKLHLTKFLFVLPLMVVLLLAFRKNDHIITPPVAPTSIVALADTIPPPPPPIPVVQPGAKITMDITPQTVNQQGYIISIADNHGECIVVIKDKSLKIVKAQSLVEWNKDKEANESQYGKIPSRPPPPPPVKLDFAPADQPLAPVKIDFAPVDQPLAPVKIDFAPAVSSDITITENLPSDVSGIVTASNIDKKKGTKTNTATVTLKNGKKEIYNLNKPDEKAKFIEKYGKQPEIRFDAVPAVPAAHVSWFKNTDTSKRPLFVVDGLIKPDMGDSHSINANEIRSLSVLKNKDATDKYGDKGKNGVVEITTLHPGITSDSTKPKNFDVDKLMTAVNSNSHPMSEALIVVDGIEKPVGFNYNDIKPATISSMTVLKGADATNKYGEKANKSAIELLTRSFENNALHVIDGKKLAAGSKWEDFIYPGSAMQIKNTKVLRGKDATDKYGDKGKNGVIEIETKKAAETNPISSKNKPVTAKFDYFIVDGSIKGNDNESFVDGSFSFGNKTEMPLLVIDGSEVYGVTSYKAIKAKYKIVSLNTEDAVAKYGDKAKYGAMEISRVKS